jgi:hypothetical protein
MTRRIVSAVLLALAPVANAQQCEVEFVGMNLLEYGVCEHAAGPAPADPALAADWAQPAIDRIVERYRVEGYVAARAWVRIRDNRVTIEVDEGTIHRVRILGVSVLNRLTLADNFEFAEGGVLYEPTLTAATEKIARREDIRSVTWSLSDGDDFLFNDLGVLVPERVLDVHIATEDPLGLGVTLSVEPRWGLVTGLRWNGANAKRGDHLSIGARLATPYQQYVFEEEPRLRWVFGDFDVGYRGGTWGSNVAPVIEARTSLADFNRDDLGVKTALVQQNRLDLGLAFAVAKPLHGRLGLAAEQARVPVFQLEEGAESVRHDSLVRIMATGRLEFTPDDGTLRTDLRDRIALTADAGWSTDDDLFYRLRLEGQVVTGVRRSDLLFRFRGDVLHDVRFFDELRLAGSHQRVFFANQYWATRAIQGELAYRFFIRRNLKVGVFHDLTLFEDPKAKLRPSFVNAVGPSVHLLLLDNYALDTYYGFGWSPGGTSHNLSLSFTGIY